MYRAQNVADVIAATVPYCGLRNQLWCLLWPGVPARQFMFWRANKAAVEEGSAERIAQIDWPSHSQPFTPQESAAGGGDQALQALAVQFSFVSETRAMVLVQNQGAPVALVGFAGEIRPTYGKMVVLEVVTALETLAVAEGLRLEADMYRLLFDRNQEALVVATEKGLIRAATSSGRTLLSRAENGERGSLLKKSEQQVPMEILSAVSFSEEIVLNRVTITGTRLGDPELNEPVITYQMHEAEPRESMDVQEATKQLTPMQSEVLRLLLRGLQYKEIARHLGNSANTVHHHVSEILRRLRCADRIELLAKFQMKSVDTDLPRKTIAVPPLTQAQLIEDVSLPPKKQAVVPEKIRATRMVAS